MTNMEVPGVVQFVARERTYLCRWDTGEEFDDGVSEVSSGSGSSDSDCSSDFEAAVARARGNQRYSDTSATPINFRTSANSHSIKRNNLRNSDTTGTSTTHTNKTKSPPSPPKRTVTPPINGDRWGNIKSGKKALNCKKASQESGVSIDDIMLQPIEFMDLKPVPKSNYTLPLSDILLNSSATEKSAAKLQTMMTDSNNNDGGDANKVTAVFCIRRAGCGMCRDHGLSLSTRLKPQLHDKNIQLNLFGIVKDLDGSGEGQEEEHRRDRKEKSTSAKILTDFYKNYFPFPLYTDKNWDSFAFLGSRKMSMWKLFQRSGTVLQRYRRKKINNIVNDPRGDPLTQGGVLLFDAKGQLRYVYYERYGDELDLEALQWAIQDIARDGQHKNDNKPNTENTNGATSTPTAPAAAPRIPRRRGTFDKGLLEGALRAGSKKTLPNDKNNSNATATPTPTTARPNGPRKPQRRGTIDDMEKAYDLHALNLEIQDDDSLLNSQ